MSVSAKIMVALLPGVVGFGVASFFGYQSYLSEDQVSMSSPSQVLMAEHGFLVQSNTQVLGESDSPLTFRVNLPARFSSTVTFDQGLDLGETEIKTEGDATFGSVTANTVTAETVTAANLLYNLVAGGGIEIDKTDTQNPTVRNTGILTLIAGDNIKVEGNKISNTYSFSPDYTQSGWKRVGTTVSLSTLTDSVEVGALTASSLVVNGITVLDGNVTVGNGVAILPDTDLGSDLGSSSYRFNNLWVANINSNSSQSFSGQTTFSYPPTDATLSQASVLINPTTSFASGQLLGLGIAGYQKALIDEDGDITLGYSDATSAPASDYPLNIYGHSGTRVSFVDTTGNGYFAGNVGIGTTSPATPLDVRYNTGGYGLTVSNTSAGGSPGSAIFSSFNGGITHLYLQQNMSAFYNDALYVEYYTAANGITKRIGIGTTSPLQKLHVNGFINSSGLIAADNNADKSISTPGNTFTYSTFSGHVFKTWDGSAYSQALVLTGNTTPYTAQNLLFTGTGNVGIGTTSPSEKLEVSGTLRLSGSTVPKITTQAGLDIDPGWGARIYMDNSITFTASGGYVMPSNDGYIPLGSSTARWGEFWANGFTLTGGNVGIGTTSPTTQLDVNGGFKATSGSITRPNNVDFSIDGPVGGAYASLRINSNTSPWYISTQNTLYGGGLNFNPGGQTNTPQMLLSRAGNLGIGTTAPGAKLEISGGATSAPYEWNALTLTQTNGEANELSTILFKDSLYPTGTSSIKHKLNSGGTSSELQFHTSNSGSSSQKLVITSAGNVGIGTTSPLSPLDVYGIARVNSLYVDSDNTASLIKVNYLEQWNGSNNLTLRTESATNKHILLLPDGTGNVGIGTTSPTAKLEVNGSIKLGSDASITIPTAYSLPGDMTISQNSGGLLIKNANWNGAARIVPYNNDVHIQNGYNGVGGLYFSGYTGNALSGDIGFLTSANIKFGPSGSEKMVITSSGNVGIGTTNPGTKLEVATATSDDGISLKTVAGRKALELLVDSGTNGNGKILMYSGINVLTNVINANAGSNSFINNGGNVGIGTTAPGEKLEVTGNIKTSSLTTGTVYSNAGVLTNTDPSDINLKENVVSLDSTVLSRVLSLRPVSFDWKKTGDGALGFIAQEVQEVFPELVGTNQDGTMGLYTTQFIPVLTRAIQEQQLEIDELKLSTQSATVAEITGEEWNGVNTLLASLKEALAALTTRVDKLAEELFTKKIRTEQLCLGTADDELCLSKDQVQQILESLPSPTPTPEPAFVEPTAPPQATDSATPSPSAAPQDL